MLISSDLPFLPSCLSKFVIHPEIDNKMAEGIETSLISFIDLMAFRPVLSVDPTVLGVWQNTLDDQQFFKNGRLNVPI